MRYFNCVQGALKHWTLHQVAAAMTSCLTHVIGYHKLNTLFMLTVKKKKSSITKALARDFFTQCYVRLVVH
jgi:hypothetical protein